MSDPDRSNASLRPSVKAHRWWRRFTPCWLLPRHARISRSLCYPRRRRSFSYPEETIWEAVMAGLPIIVCVAVVGFGLRLLTAALWSRIDATSESFSVRFSVASLRLDWRRRMRRRYRLLAVGLRRGGKARNSCWSCVGIRWLPLMMAFAGLLLRSPERLPRSSLNVRKTAAILDHGGRAWSANTQPPSYQTHSSLPPIGISSTI
jgi:hypothetical protein